MSLRLVLTVVFTLAVIAAGGVYLMTARSSALSPSNQNTGQHRAGPPVPGAILNLNDWKLQLPVESGQSGEVEEVKWPALASYSSWYFHLNDAGNGVVFRATAGGATTPGAEFARSELRQMADGGTRQAAWSSAGSTWIMTIRESITYLPPRRPAIVAGQIHGIGSHYVALVRLDDHLLWVKTEAGSAGNLDEHYQLGTVFTVMFVASGDVIRIYYNDVLKVELHEQCTGCYFKAGAYLQSNTKWDAPDAYGEVIIYDLKVSHSSS